MARNSDEYDCPQFWHLCTPGKSQCLIFRNKSDYVAGMNLVALSANKFSETVEIYAFELMSNHFHFLIKAHLVHKADQRRGLCAGIDRFLHIRVTHCVEIPHLVHKAYL